MAKFNKFIWPGAGLISASFLAGMKLSQPALAAAGHDSIQDGLSRTFEYVTLGLFAVAILHTFFVSKFAHLAHKYPQGSVRENFFHLLSEVEAVFLIWSGVMIAVISYYFDWGESVHYLENLDFTEPMFVFAIMIIAATKPVIDLADRLIRLVDKVLPMTGSAGFLVAVLTIGSLLGSLITEPAAMTVSALILLRQFFMRNISMKLKYVILATLFVNVSIGGSLTHFAAPPVIMVAEKWGWGLTYMLANFGWKSAVAILINAVIAAWLFRKELRSLPVLKDSDMHGEGSAQMKSTPWWVTAVHILFLAFTVLNAHHAKVFMGGFLFFLGFATITREYQEKLKLRESLLVAGFLAGLVTLGSLQKWWIEPLITQLTELPLFFGAVLLTSFTDNAALTFLASQAADLSTAKQYLIVAGALAGGGLTVIANAPNPAGYAILNSSFGPHGHGINPMKLLAAALFPTAVAISCLWLLPGWTG